ncbi:unnamed protein product, partial [Lymnaea stagnalis]
LNKANSVFCLLNSLFSHQIVIQFYIYVGFNEKMPTEGTASSYMWRKSRMKFVMTKRSASMSDRQRKRTSSKNDDDDNNEIEDDFTSCFIDDDESDIENNDSLFLKENHEEKEINDKQ